MARLRTWKVVGWESRRPGTPDGEPIEHRCYCGRVAWIPTAGRPGGAVIFTKSHDRGELTVVLDPPSTTVTPGWLPDAIQCRSCGRMLTDNEEDLRVR